MGRLLSFYAVKKVGVECYGLPAPPNKSSSSKDATEIGSVVNDEQELNYSRRASFVNWVRGPLTLMKLSLTFVTFKVVADLEYDIMGEQGSSVQTSELLDRQRPGMYMLFLNQLSSTVIDYFKLGKQYG